MTPEEIDAIVEAVDVMASCETDFDDDMDTFEDVRRMGELLKRYIAAFDLLIKADLQEVEQHKDKIIQAFIIGRGT